MADLSSIASLATAGGTLVLAVATFASVRSGNRVARLTERSLLAGIRPVLAPGRLEDPVQKITWGDEHRTRLPGGMAGVELERDVIYLAIPLRNVGNGMAVLQGWDPLPSSTDLASGHSAPSDFRRQHRDLYIPPNDIGFWQGALRDRSDEHFPPIEEATTGRNRFSIDLLYTDHEGGQRTISRFNLVPSESADVWLCTVV